MALFDRFRRTPRSGVTSATRPRRKPEGSTKQKGRSGTINYRGFIADDEVELALRAPQRYTTYETMRRDDPSVRGMHLLLTTPVRATPWSIEPGGQEPEHYEQAGFVRHTLFGSDLEGGFDEWIRQMLDFLLFGHMVFERVADLRNISYRWKDKEDIEQETSREAFVLAKLAVRLPHTIVQWVPRDDDPSTLKEIVQELAGGAGILINQDGSLNQASSETRQPRIPAKDLVIFVNEKLGDDWRGLSILRSAYKPYLYKERLQSIEAIALERSAGLPVVYPPDSVNADDPVLDDVENVIKNIRQGENVYALMPGPKATADNDGWLLEDISINATDVDFSAPIQRYEAAMSRNILAEFMRLGHDQTGARATADVQQDPYYQAVEALTGAIETVINEQIIKPLIDWNYETDVYPTISSSKVQAKDLSAIASYFSQLASAGMIHPTPELEAWFRRLADAPEAPTATEEEEERGGMAGGWRPWNAAGSNGTTPPAPAGDGTAPGEGEPIGSAEENGNGRTPGSGFTPVRFPTSTFAEGRDTAMVALFPSPEIAARLGDAASEDPADLHVTLAFLGEIVESRRERTVQAVRRWAATCPALEGNISGVGTFASGSGPGSEEPVTYASVDLPDLPDQRQLLVEELEGSQVPVSRDHGFTPHMTLGYGPMDAPVFDSPIELRFTSVFVAWGDERLEIPLTGPRAGRTEVQSTVVPGFPDWTQAGEVMADLDADLSAAIGLLEHRGAATPESAPTAPPLDTEAFATMFGEALAGIPAPEVNVTIERGGRVRKTIGRDEDGMIETIEERELPDDAD